MQRERSSHGEDRLSFSRANHKSKRSELRIIALTRFVGKKREYLLRYDAAFVPRFVIYVVLIVNVGRCSLLFLSAAKSRVRFFTAEAKR